MSVTASTATPTSASPGSPATTASPVTRAPATTGTRPPAGGRSPDGGDAPARGGLPVSAVSLLARARVLESRSAHAHPTLAGAYRRRAAELRLEAWLRAVKSTPPPDIEHFTTLAA
jgi:hypothetical protein